MRRRAGLTGRRFGRLTVLGESPEPYCAPSGKVTPRWDCLCDCGKRVAVRQNALLARSGGTRSCGCARSDAMRRNGAERQSYRVCAVCGKRFPAPPSSDRTTCSRECSSARKTQTHVGKRIAWSEKARESYGKRIAESPERLEALRESARNATEAAKLSPNSGAFETNIHAKSWMLKSPENRVYEFDNLRNFIRENADRFPNAKSAHTALSGYGKYKGWQVIYSGPREKNK